MSTLLSARGLVVGWRVAVAGPLDFRLARGEILGLGGANGTGKSTLLAALAGVSTVFSGSLERAAGLRVGYQTQAAAPVEGLPVAGRELLALTGADPKGLPDWLAGCLEKRLDRLSGGQRQYLALWAVLAAPADLLLLDEPTNNLDAAGCRHLTEELRRRAALGAGVILVSHDAEFFSAVCDNTLHLGAAR